MADRTKPEENKRTPARGVTVKSRGSVPTQEAKEAEVAADKPKPTQKPKQKPQQAVTTEDTVVRPAFTEKVKQKVARVAAAATHESEPLVGNGKGPRRARLRLTRIDPWSVLKVSFLLSVAFSVVTFVAVLIVWSVLGAAGVWESINATVHTIETTGNQQGTFDVTDYVGMGRVLGFTLVVSVVNVVLLTAMATLGAFLYNMASALLGGVDVTLSEDVN